MSITTRRHILEKAHLQQLIELLQAEGYEVVGPTLREGVITYDTVAAVDDLPAGWGDEQDGGHYRAIQREDNAYFGYTVGPQSWKRFLYPPRLKLWEAMLTSDGFDIAQDDTDQPQYALLGVRACELHAIAIQDRIFMEGDYVDPAYHQRRQNALIIAVNCGQAAATCFCASMGTGPQVSKGYDLALTEVIEEDTHFFVIEAGSDKGTDLLDKLPHRPATDDEAVLPEQIAAVTAEQMGRTLETEGIKELLYRNYEHPQWDTVAERCLACSNCTMVCPTCFCHTVEDVTDLAGETAERWRVWDSCFTSDFSYIHGGEIRKSGKSRYRQWMTHKLATWFDQFDTSGCVGCGRCITWCPVGIDITAELQAIRDSEIADNTSEQKDAKQ